MSSAEEIRERFVGSQDMSRFYSPRQPKKNILHICFSFVVKENLHCHRYDHTHILVILIIREAFEELAMRLEILEHEREEKAAMAR